jgi:hypothetical protein
MSSLAARYRKEVARANLFEPRLELLEIVLNFFKVSEPDGLTGLAGLKARRFETEGFAAGSRQGNE